MEKLPISVGILSWNSGQTLVDTLTSYFDKGFINHFDDIYILFQECSDDDVKIAEHFGIPYIALTDNVGIGKGFLKLASNAWYDRILLLEHDWHIIEDQEVSWYRLAEGLSLIQDKGYHCVRYRHRKNPGNPHFSFRHKGNELNYYDEEIGCTSPHLLDSLHWLDPSEQFPDKIQKSKGWFLTSSRWANWTNNPCMYSKHFYIDTVSQFAGDGIALEGNISRWWAQQNFKVAHGEGLFCHIDKGKYGK